MIICFCLFTVSYSMIPVIIKEKNITGVLNSKQLMSPCLFLNHGGICLHTTKAWNSSPIKENMLKYWVSLRMLSALSAYPLESNVANRATLLIFLDLNLWPQDRGFSVEIGQICDSWTWAEWIKKKKNINPFDLTSS